MAGIMAQAVARLKDDVQRFLRVAFVAQVAWELGLCWRETALALPNLVAWFGTQKGVIAASSALHRLLFTTPRLKRQQLSSSLGRK